MTGQSSTLDPPQDLILVSNGSEFFRIPSDDLSAAQADGFYRPQDRGLTIVSDGMSPFELPLSELDWAEANGFRDLLKVAPTLAAANTNQPVAATVAHPTLGNINEDLKRLTEPTEEEIEQDRMLEESEGLKRAWLQFQYWVSARRAQLSRQLGGTGISIMVHIAIILLMASFAFIDEKPPSLSLVASPTNSSDMIDEVVIDITPIDVADPTEESDSEPPPESSEVPMELEAEAPDLSGAIVGAAIKPPAKPSLETFAKGAGKAAKPTLFGSSLAATNYVFVIDNSNCMTRGRFETALYELMLTINQLTPKQRFYIIFYSDTAYPMMHPNAVLKLVPATNTNKQRVYQWLQTVPMCLQTRGMEALNAAFQLNPDVIYVLGDGAFTDKAGDYFAARPHKRIIVHTRGMEVKPKDAIVFRKLAEANRGTYKDVGVSPQGALMAKQNPRPRNNKRGPVWGLKLPLTAKKKK